MLAVTALQIGIGGDRGDALRGHPTQRLFELVETELGPHHADAVEDREKRTF